MSWTKVSEPHGVLRQDAKGNFTPIHEPPWLMDIWETNDDTGPIYPYGHNDPGSLDLDATFRVIFAPLDLPREDTLPQLIRLLEVFSVPREFSVERVQSVAHSFGVRTQDAETNIWFHFLCKRIELLRRPDGSLVVDHRPHALAPEQGPVLPQATYSWHRSGFFLKALHDGRTSLVCFGATPQVRSRLIEFMQSSDFHIARAEPLVLLDLILEGLYIDIDTTLWNMGDVFGPLEHNILALANSKNTTSISREINFAELHNCAKHVIYIAEAIESMLLVVDRLAGQLHSSTTKRDPTREQVLQQLTDSLAYRRSLFQSSKMRQTSLQKRIDNAITLSFNLVTQQDSMVMIQDSNSMKTIAAITMVFLPTTTVAAVLGSQLFVSELNNTDGSWTVQITPPFLWLWWIAIPMTLLVALFAWFWRLYTHRRLLLLPPSKSSITRRLTGLVKG